MGRASMDYADEEEVDDTVEFWLLCSIGGELKKSERSYNGRAELIKAANRAVLADEPDVLAGLYLTEDGLPAISTISHGELEGDD